MKRTCWVLLAAILSASLLQAQSISSSIYGRVLDPSGNIVPGATVRATHVDTGTVYQFITDSLGQYDFPQVRPGAYRLEAEMKGFQTTVQGGIVLELNQRAKIDLELKVGNLSEKVEVTAAAPLLETASGAMGQEVTPKQVQDLPLAQRMPWYLGSVDAGVVAGYDTQVVNQVFNRVNDFSINGSLPGTNEYMVDGVSAQAGGDESAGMGFTYISVYPPIEATQEFKIFTNSYSAEFGKSGGGVVTLSIKSGSNQFHGATYDFLQNSVLSANQWFNDADGVSKLSQRQNQFGAAIGGPIIRNKTFFFFDYQGLRSLTQGQPTQSTLPTAPQIGGDFSSLKNASGGAITIYDPNTADPGVNRTPFPGNVIPASRIDPVAAKIAALIPTTGLSAGAPFTGIGNATYNAPFTFQQNQWDLKLDQKIGNNHQIFFRDSWYHDLEKSSPDLPGSTWSHINPLDNGGELFPDQTYQLAAGYTWSMNPNTLFDVRAGVTRLAWKQIISTYCVPGSCSSDPFNPTSLGFPSYLNSLNSQYGMPPMSFVNYATFGPVTNPQQVSRTVLSLQPSLTKIHGRHVMKFGFDARQNQAFSGGWSYTNGSFSFNDGFTQQNSNVSAPNTAGNSFASFLLGTAASGSITKTITDATRSGYYAFYAQDDIKLTSKLTINPGLRWDISVPAHEINNRMSLLALGAVNPIGAPAGMPNLKGGLEFPGQGSLKGVSTTIPTQWHDFAPRMGIAYQLTPKTVIRSGAGIFFINSYFDAEQMPQTDFTAVTSMTTSIDGAHPYNYLSNPFPQGFVLPANGANGLLSEVGVGIAGFAGTNNARTPYMAQWNLNIERQLPGNLLFEAAYVGSTSKELQRGNLGLDELAPQYVAQYGNALNGLVSNPFYGLPQIPASSILSKPTVQLGQLLRPYPQFTAVTEWDPNGSSTSYNALNLKLEKRFSNGLTLLVSYSDSKNLTDITGIPGFLSDGNRAFSQGSRTIYNFRYEWSLSPIDISQRFVASYTYALPFGHGRKWLNHSGPADWVLGGWQVNGIATISTGMPVTITTSNNYMGFGAGTQRPNATGISPVQSGSAESRLGGVFGPKTWYNTAAFSQPVPFTIGNLAPTIGNVRSDGVHNWDCSFFKTFKITERFNLTYRAEMFNFLNTPTYQQPNATFTAATFGDVTSTANTARQIQMALRFAF